MRNLNRYILLAGCCVGGFVTLDAMAAYDCAKINTSCSDLGYTYIVADCAGNGYVACPFNTSVGVCDQEGDSGDYKFTRESAVTTDWTDKSSTFNDMFVNGALTSSYCGQGSTVGATTTSTKYPSHTHGTTTMGITVVNGSRYNGDGVGETNPQVWTGRSIQSNYTFSNTSTSVKSFGKTISSSTVYPVHKTVKMFLYSPTYTMNSSAVGEVPNSQPTCASLGYVDKVAHCPGAYVSCPMDSSAVMCDMQAKAGEIKFSLQAGNHDGWLLADGSTLTGVWAKSELKSLLGTTTLPNYKGMFLKIGSSVSDTLVEDTIPAHSHPMIAASWPTKTANDKAKEGNKSTSWRAADPKYTVPQQRTSSGEDLTTSAYGDNETAPPHYIANVFIYSGKLNK